MTLESDFSEKLGGGQEIMKGLKEESSLEIFLKLGEPNHIIWNY